MTALCAIPACKGAEQRPDSSPADESSAGPARQLEPKAEGKPKPEPNEADGEGPDLREQTPEDARAHVMPVRPEPEFAINAVFGKRIRLIGFDIDHPLRAGEQSTFTWYWEALAPIERRWKAFAHLDHVAEPFRQNLDHNPTAGVYMTDRWKPGEIIQDIQTVRLTESYPPGPAVLHLGLRDDRDRLPVTNSDVVSVTSEDRPRVIGPTFDVLPAG